MKKASITIQEKEVFIYLTGIKVLQENENFVIFKKAFTDIEKRSLATHFDVEILGDNITVSKRLITQLNGIKF